MTTYYVNKRRGNNTDLEYKDHEDFIKNRPFNTQISQPRDIGDGAVHNDFDSQTGYELDPDFKSSAKYFRSARSNTDVPRRASRTKKGKLHNNVDLIREANDTYYRIQNMFNSHHPSTNLSRNIDELTNELKKTNINFSK